MTVEVPFRLSQPGDPCDELDALGDGVLGYAIEHNGAIYVPMIEAISPGNGDVGRWLDALPAGLDVRIPNVISGRLLGMLKRRGWLMKVEDDATTGETVEVWSRAFPRAKE